MALNNVGEAMTLSGNVEEALEYVQDALAMKTRLFGEEHPKCASSIAAVGSTLIKLERLEEGERYLRRAHDIYVEVAGPTHALSIAMMSKLGALYVRTERARKAIPYLRAALSGRGKDTSAAQGSDRLRLAKALWARSEREGASEQEAALLALIESHGERAPSEVQELSAALRAWRQTR